MKKKLFKTILSLLLVVFFTGSGYSQKKYYVSSSGNDSNNGTSPATAWKTLTKVNSNKRSFQAGDIINFKRGDIFYGTLDFKGKSGTAAQPIVLKSYGSGDRPVIRASRKINNWRLHSGNIWKANLPKINNSRTPSLFLNNKAQQIGREPNTSAANGGYRTINSHAQNNRSISESSGLPYAANRFKGGEIVIRTTDDNVKVETIISHSGNTVNFSLEKPGDNFENKIEDNFGYFFQNHVKALDLNGEWAHDINTGVLYLYSNTNPNGLSVEVPNSENTIAINNAKYINIEDLRFEGSLSSTFALSGAQNVNVSGCYFYNGNNYLILGFTLTNITFTNNTINESNNVGMRLEGCSGLNFSNNKITNIGMRSGMGARSFIGYTGVRFISRSGASENIIEKNTLNKIGYHALNFSGGNFKIRYNDIQDYCYTKDDGGGIYTVGTHDANNRIHGNIVHDSPGAIRGIPAGRGVKTAGIYIDNDSQNQLIYKNTVYNVVGWGLMANLSSKSTIRDNTVYNCSIGLVLSTYPNSFAAGGNTAKATDNKVLRNIFFNRKSSQVCARYTNQITESGFNTFLGEVNNNYYCQPFNGGKEISIRVGRRENSYVLSEFKSTYPNYEKKGVNAPVKFNASVNPNSIIRFEVNNTGSVKQINLGSTNYVDAKNVSYTGSVTLQPYTSLALLKGQGGTPDPDPTPTDQLIDNDLYFLTSTTSNQRLRSVENKNNHDAYMVNPSGKNEQQWIFKHLGDNIYTIKNKRTQRFLEVPFAACKDGEQVSTYDEVRGDHQKWKVVKNGNAIYGLKPAHCLGQGLDRNFGQLNTNVITHTYHKSNVNQKWKIVLVDNTARLSVDEINEQENSILLFPNPSRDKVNIEGLTTGDVIRISNLTGKTLFHKQVANDEISIELTHFASGLYLVSISGEGKATVQSKLLVD
ncbi:hypothetical protein A8C32_08700 [Flavivirga aquatica]|uniref:Ricin B lectin domain-containing protein n=1 Tax=Flavivirga aquatica TaxID=1849968 RepID=A0A1E5SJE1_9FLAO|nr:RICIN domain-containing protein [Flavivirga aquatica]OEJ99238.1 hypothetical protein A8C32_08700 [Flavivirga aquatica]